MTRSGIPNNFDELKYAPYVPPNIAAWNSARGVQ